MLFFQAAIITNFELTTKFFYNEKTQNQKLLSGPESQPIV